jgi:hypothetical protein
LSLRMETPSLRRPNTIRECAWRSAFCASLKSSGVQICAPEENQSPAR